jgi:opacity protein-like surface antigen
LGWRIDYYSPTPLSVRNLSKIAHTRRFRALPDDQCDNQRPNYGTTFGGNPALNAVEGVSFSNDKTGYTVGGGVEAGLWGNWTVKVEYLYVDFGRVSTTGFIISPTLMAAGSNNNPFTNSFDLKASIARIGINYKFGGPVAAKY